MRIYTRSGDRGETWVIGGRTAKDDPRVEAYGTIDELNAAVGLAAAEMAEGPGDLWADLREDLYRIQNELFDCGSDLSYAEPVPEKMKVHGEMVRLLEVRIDRLSEEAPPVRRFILPGGSRISAYLHLCRTICRRAERRTVALARVGPCPEEVLRYLNRLSDYFFAAARAANARLGVPDQEYVRSADVFGRGPQPPQSDEAGEER
ncbi:MAG: ATP:cob(I)alamin adenosyltransferase [Paenibacillaceae bacterium ZCTH02-B3]|nr:MAG: ATP:cob(I)alamin adenosyltransferase [Paenibacillaceae bacterium ZCTH02-B3]